LVRPLELKHRYLFADAEKLNPKLPGQREKEHLRQVKRYQYKLLLLHDFKSSNHVKLKKPQKWVAAM
jgi:hypothetical protein